jgi:PAS domain S-box-containing protein
VGLRETIDLALHLHPDAQAVAIVTEAPGFWWAVAHSELDRHRDRVKEVDLFGPPGTTLLERIAALPPHTLILFQLAALSGKESDVKTRDVLAAASKHLPTYCAWKSELNHGCVGGAYVDWDKYVESTAEIAARVLTGERPEEIQIANDSDFKTMVDWRQLRRWHIPESALPPGTEILYREPTFWERDRNYLIPVIALIAAQLVVVLGWLWERARKRKAEAVLRESEKRFQVMADTTPSLVWMCDARGRITYLNEQRIAFTGPDAKAGYGDSWAAYVHEDDLQNVLDTVSQALEDHKAFSMEYRLRRHDGAYRWMFDVASPRLNGDGSFGGFIGSAIDVTDQKLAQQALERLSGQLIEAQEKERRRIARELHDDICQRLALLSMKIEQANQSLTGTTEAAQKSMQEVRQACTDIAVGVQSLSHQLHSSVLDFLGVSVAISRLCTDFSKQHGVRIEFYKSNVPEHLPKDISLCLFRVAQEAVHNAVKYSEARLVTVELTGTADVIELAVSDEGKGFDLEQARRKGGLGLLSMQERAHLCHGKFSIESTPGEGTTILVVLPLTPRDRVKIEERPLAETTNRL